ncbi:unnamed protein product [Cylicocyclus nassatus]|uniref:Nematode cuticle collagen N-terminal domain-containing protein n=1 Tax=Cylicocyclus nassatus TaxID=53992 RepID=A0AA36GIW3_CYLNA|nr:unnamed protein product [Cylicocyclus nassatus]
MKRLVISGCLAVLLLVISLVVAVIVMLREVHTLQTEVQAGMKELKVTDENWNHIALKLLRSNERRAVCNQDMCCSREEPQPQYLDEDDEKNGPAKPEYDPYWKIDDAHKKEAICAYNGRSFEEKRTNLELPL